MKTFSVRFKYNDRSKGPEERTFRVEATSITTAMGRACREFWNSLDRKQRFDAAKELSATVTRAEESAPAESSGSSN
jgi:hypothetical protein